MIDSVMNLLFRCPHKRTTRPMTPVRKPGEPPPDTYVVCLECGKQFLYDLEEMRMGKAVPVSPMEGVLQETPLSSQSKKLRYVAWSALPIALGVGAAIKWMKKNGEKPKA
jgi:hypothetical protein